MADKMTKIEHKNESILVKIGLKLVRKWWKIGGKWEFLIIGQRKNQQFATRKWLIKLNTKIGEKLVKIGLKCSKIGHKIGKKIGKKLKICH